MKVRRKRLLAFAVGLVLVVSLVSVSSCGTIRAGFLVRDALRPPDALASEVIEEDASIESQGQTVRVRIYRPKEEHDPLPGVVLVHGAVRQGALDSRLVALARAMAAHGGCVATLDLVSLSSFTLDPHDPLRIAAATAWFSKRKDIVRDGRVALVGISVGGTYALLAGSTPKIKDRLSAILTFGAYSSLDRLLRRWLIQPGEGTPELLDPKTRGRRLVLLGNVDKLVAPAEAGDVRRGVSATLAGEVPQVTDELSMTARLILEVARSEGAITVDKAERLMAPLSVEIEALSLEATAAVPTCPIYLLHSSNDPVVDIEELAALGNALEREGATVFRHETDLFRHVSSQADQPSLFEAWPLLSYLADFLDDTGY